MPINDQSGSLPIVNKEHLPYTPDDGIGHRARIGIIALPDDQTIEHELRMIFNLPGVACFTTRLPCAAAITPASLNAMESDISRAASLILPNLSVDIIAYGCTSGSLFIGPAAIHNLIHEAHPHAICTTPIEAAMAAIKALGTRNLALITPYENEINLRLAAFLQRNDYHIPVLGSWNEPIDAKVGCISPETIRQVALELGSSNLVDTVFISCTNLRALSIITELESELSKPVICSNQVLGWHCLRLIGKNVKLPQFGRLFTSNLYLK